MKLLLNLLYAISRFFGWLVHPIKGSRTDYIKHRVKREFSTQIYKNEFKAFGKYSYIASGIVLKSPEHISIGVGTSINENVLLRCYGKNSEMVIGSEVSIGSGTSISCVNRIVLGDGVTTGRDVLIDDNSHGYNDSIQELDVHPMLRDIVSKGPIIIEDNVWIGEKASILSGVTIGRGSIIGANAVVTKDIPPYSIAVGCPAGVIKTVE